MRAAICEDEKVFADDLRNKVNNFFADCGEKIDFDMFSDGTQLLSSVENGSQYDIIFLDIQLENSSGMETAAMLRELDRIVPIIFVTGIEYLASDGYSVGAFDYIIKSSLDDKLESVLLRFVQSQSEKNIVTENLQGEIEVIPVGEILYVESEGRHSLIHTEKEEIQTALPIGKLSEMLTAEKFVEVYKSIYVCTIRIKSIAADTLELSDGKILPLSRRRRKAVLSAVMRQVKNS